ncbi:MAG: hypothetical protein JWN70_6243 [Planctomycetaceae bacterium]|nr:hypothetical protein [Planctomycetaceae bacterium]
MRLTQEACRVPGLVAGQLRESSLNQGDRCTSPARYTGKGLNEGDVWQQRIANAVNQVPREFRGRGVEINGPTEAFELGQVIEPNQGLQFDRIKGELELPAESSTRESLDDVAGRRGLGGVDVFPLSSVNLVEIVAQTIGSFGHDVAFLFPTKGKRNEAARS